MLYKNLYTIKFQRFDFPKFLVSSTINLYNIVSISENMNRGEQIQKVRKEKGLTQSDLAKKADMPYTTLAKTESGKVTNLTITTLKKIADDLESSVDYLLS